MKGFGSKNAGSMPRPPRRPRPNKVGNILTQTSKTPIKGGRY